MSILMSFADVSRAFVSSTAFPRRRLCSLEFFLHRVTRVFQHLEGPDLLECRESFFNYTFDHSVSPTVRSSWTDCGGRPPSTDDFGPPPPRRDKMDATPIVPTPEKDRSPANMHTTPNGSPRTAKNTRGLPTEHSQKDRFPTGVGSLSTGPSGSAASGSDLIQGALWRFFLWREKG